MPQDHLAVSFRSEHTRLALEHVFTDKRQLGLSAATLGSQTVLPPEVILFQCLCILAQDNPQADDTFFAHYGIRLVASIIRELAGVCVTTFFLLAHWSQVITTPTRAVHPLGRPQIAIIREQLTDRQAERAANVEGYSNACASTEHYTQAFGFVKALLLV